MKDSREIMARFRERFPGDTAELLDGAVFEWPPASPSHREVRGILMEQLRNVPGVHEAPFPVYLTAETEDASGSGYDGESAETMSGQTIVRPDICLVRDRAGAEKAGFAAEEACFARVPVFVIEIMTPDNKQRNRLIQEVKLGLYSEAGVEEVWLVDGKRREVRVYCRSGNALCNTHLALQFETLYSKAVKGCGVDLRNVLARRKWK